MSLLEVSCRLRYPTGFEVNADFSTAVAFVDVNARPRTWTCDRTEFIGRNGSLAAPAALERATWSGSAGAALDPCAALQTSFDLQPDEEKQIVFLLGEAANLDEARRLAVQYREPGHPVGVMNAGISA